MDHVSLLKALLAKGYDQNTLAKALETTQPTISRWLKGTKPDYAKFQAIIDLARENDLVNGDVDKHQTEGGVVNDAIPEIDVIGGMGGGGFANLEVAAKNGISFAKESIRDYWRLPPWVTSRLNVTHDTLAAFPVQGDSMDPTLSDGDVIFIDTRHRVPSPPGLYALADEFGGVIVKRLEVTSRPGEDNIRVSVISDNERHKTRELLLNEIHIIGRYVGRFTI